ncbi:MAG: tryptophan 7-halogenase [Cytophagaceae bacterium]|nr:MAG: tryptophan 7-halogenase [Cytophagaceae bacterium]
MARYLGRKVSITLIESDEISTVGVGEATIPSIRRFHAALGIDEATFMAATGATHKLGIDFIDWHQTGQRYFHPFGKLGTSVAGVGFLHAYLRLREEGLAEPLWRYSPNAVAAAARKFGAATGVDKAVASAFPYAYHLDAGRYAQMLRDYAGARGVERIAGTVGKIERDASGCVTTLSLEDGRKVAGDLFVDCSGGRAILIGDEPDNEWEDWSAFLPCDRAVVVQTEAVRDPVPYTQASAMVAGWRWSIPLQHRVGNGYVYSSAHCDAETAKAELIRSVEGSLINQPRTLSFRTGRRSRFWQGNVVAIGLSAGFLEPLESTSIHLIQTGITSLLNLFPRDRESNDLAAFYNQQMVTAFEGVRDFIILHYIATQRTGSSFWDYIRQMNIPKSLKDRVELFRGRGRFVRDENELFTLDSWVTVMLGQGIDPNAYSVTADGIPIDLLAETAERHVKQIESVVEQMVYYRYRC